MRTAASIAVCALITACTASADDVRPPANQLFFPTGLALSPDEHVLFVTNANSELRYDSGTIGVIDLDKVQAYVNLWAPLDGSNPVNPDTANCQQDTDFRETLVCDETPLMKADAAVRVGNFATDIAVQDFSENGTEALRVIAPTRGDPSISWADYDGTKLRCTSPAGTFDLCDDSHRLTTVRNDDTLPSIPNEPFGVFADSANGFAVVTHMANGAVTLLDSPRSGPAQVVDIKVNVFLPDLTTGIRTSTGVAGRSPGSSDDIVYVSSASQNLVQTYTVGAVAPSPGAAPEAAYLLPNNAFVVTSVGANDGGISDERGMQFSPTGDRMYLIDRDPPALIVYDTSVDATGYPRNITAGASDICREASLVTVLDPGDGERAYVTCFEDGQIYVIDPRGQSQVEDIITVGRGPYGIAAAKGANPGAGGRKQLFVSNFLEDTIAVIDVSPNSVNRNRVVLRIGVPRPPQ